MSLTQTAARPRGIEIDGDAQTFTAPRGYADGRLASFSELGIAALALPGGAGRHARRFGLTVDEVVAESNGRVTYSAVPIDRIVVAVGLAYALEHASGACRRARAFAASAPAGVTVRTFLQTLPALEEIPSGYTAAESSPSPRCTTGPPRRARRSSRPCARTESRYST